jgi:hypothetical protein
MIGKGRRLFLFILVIALAVPSSCKLIIDQDEPVRKYTYPELTEEEKKEIATSYESLDTRNFFALVGNYFYTVRAVKLAENERCIVYGEQESYVRLETAVSIAAEFTDKIYPVITGVFGDYRDVDGNGKIILLLLDIQDDYAASGTYIAGYFYPGDLERDKANDADMLYLDTYPGLRDPTNLYTTIAHEFQHLINYSIRLSRRTTSQDTWIDEGLASAAESIYLNGETVNAKIEHFNQKGYESSISTGNNFFVWLNDRYVLDEYATVYLFFQWLGIHADNTTGIYTAIINSDKTDYNAVLDAAIVHISGISSWEELLQTWFLANYVNAQTGLLGYERKISTRVYAIGNQAISLRPGEAVYSNLNSGEFSKPNNVGANIQYTGITRGGHISPVSPHSGDKLLAFNANMSNSSSERSETAALSGQPGDALPAYRSANQAQLIPIDMIIPAGARD